MDNPAASIDSQVFAHTARLFEEKRRVLPPEVLEGFARQVVSRVAETATARVPANSAGIGPERVAAFCDLLLKSDQSRQALAFITARRDEGATKEDVYLGYIGAAARLLGKRWEEGELTPFQVTIGAGTLYALMRALRGSLIVNQPFDPSRAALFATVPGEQHGVGVTVAADMFREAGWEVDLQLGLDQPRLLDHVTRTLPRVIGLSLSTPERVPELVQAAVGLRLIVPEAIIGVAHGGDLTAADVQRIADVDLVFDDAPSAITRLERWVRDGSIADDLG